MNTTGPVEEKKKNEELEGKIDTLEREIKELKENDRYTLESIAGGILHRLPYVQPSQDMLPFLGPSSRATYVQRFRYIGSQ